MFGLNTMIRSVATGVAASVDSASRTFVGTLAIAEEAIERRSTEFARASRTAQYEMELTKDLEESARALGHKSVEDGVNHVNNVKALLLSK